jgi:hypothetical protein
MLQRIQKFHFIYIMPSSFLAFSMVDYILYIYMRVVNGVFFIENGVNVVEHGAEIL